MANEYRENLYDAQGRLWGCYYPQTGKLVKRTARQRVEIDLSPYLRADKAQTDTRQKENTSV